MGTRGGPDVRLSSSQSESGPCDNGRAKLPRYMNVGERSVSLLMIQNSGKCNQKRKCCNAQIAASAVIFFYPVANVI